LWGNPNDQLVAKRAHHVEESQDRPKHPASSESFKLSSQTAGRRQLAAAGASRENPLAQKLHVLGVPHQIGRRTFDERIRWRDASEEFAGGLVQLLVHPGFATGRCRLNQGPGPQSRPQATGATWWRWPAGPWRPLTALAVPPDQREQTL
jgi:hypothetical protein